MARIGISPEVLANVILATPKEPKTVPDMADELGCAATFLQPVVRDLERKGDLRETLRIGAPSLFRRATADEKRSELEYVNRVAHLRNVARIVGVAPVITRDGERVLVTLTGDEFEYLAALSLPVAVEG